MDEFDMCKTNAFLYSTRHQKAVNLFFSLFKVDLYKYMEIIQCFVNLKAVKTFLYSSYVSS